MSDMKNLMKNWRGYEDNLYDGEERSATPAPVTLLNEADLGQLIKGLNTMGLPTAEEIEALRNLSDEDLANLNTSGQAVWDNMKPKEIRMLNSGHISEMAPKQAETAALTLRRSGKWDTDLMRQLNSRSLAKAESPITRNDIEEIANFQWSDLIHDPTSATDNAMLATQAGLAAVTGGVGSAFLKAKQIGGKVVRGAKLLKKYKSVKRARDIAAAEQSLAVARRLGIKGPRETATMAIRLDLLKSGQTLDQYIEAGQKVNKAETAEDIVSAVDDIDTVADVTDAAKAGSKLKKTAIAGTVGTTAWVGTGLAPDPFSPSGEVTPPSQTPITPAVDSFDDNFVPDDVWYANGRPVSVSGTPHPGEVTSPASTQGTSTSKNTTPSPTPAPLNPTPDPSGKCPDGQIYVSSPLGGGCQTPAKNEGYDIKKIIAEELESFLNKREL